MSRRDLAYVSNPSGTERQILGRAVPGEAGDVIGKMRPPEREPFAADEAL